MLAVIAAQTLVAFRRYAATAAGWAVGVVVFAVTVAIGAHVITRVTHAFLLGAAASLAVFGSLMTRTVSRWLMSAPTSPP
jgi:hypothetical protein